MKFAIIGLLALLGLAPLAFAQSDACERSCCDSNGGTWDSDFGTCEYPSDGYYSCINQCEGMAGGSVNCCGSAFILGSIGAALFLSKKQ